MSVFVPNVLNSAGEPTYQPSSEKGYISEINQPPSGDLDASPLKTATQHSHTSDSGHETDSIEEGEARGNPEPMVVDELVKDEDTPEDDLHNSEGTNNPQGEGGYVEDTTMEEENECNPIPVPDDYEGFEGKEVNAGEKQAQTQTLATPTMEVVQMAGVSTSSTRGLSTEDWLF